MIVEDQTETMAFLSRPDTYGAADGAPVERLDTHISVVFKVGCRVFKLKRAVRFSYLDFSTADLREAACREEVRANGRMAPDLYIGVLPVTRDGMGGLVLGGDGAAVDWVVEMVRFDDANLFDRLAARGGLRRRLMEDLAAEIAGFHAGAEPTGAHGGRAGLAFVIDSNARCFAEAAPGTFDPARVARLGDLSRQTADRLRDLLDARRAEGRVRHCHGDLHLRNICLMGDPACGREETLEEPLRPVLFDGIEFNPAISHIDVLYDLAFLLMDLEHRELRRLAGILFNRYMDITGDTGGLAALPLFLSVRAAVRAQVGGIMAAVRDDAAARRAEVDGARGYLERALGYFDPPPPRLLAVGGLSGSGKSRMARETAPFLHDGPGALVLRTDVLRKRLFGLNMFETAPPEAYGADMSRRTYDLLYSEAEAALRAGRSVVADGIFAAPGERAAIAGLAGRLGIRFDGLWLAASPDVQAERIATRTRNPSDATPDVLRRQLDYDLGEIAWTRIDSSGRRETTLDAGLAALGIAR